MTLLPPNKTALEARLAETLADATALPVNHHSLWNPATCPLNILPWLAWAVGVVEWSAEWPEQQQRAVVAAALERRRRLGNVTSTQEAIENLGLPGLLFSEWFSYGGNPATYRIINTVPGREMDQSQYDQIINTLHRNSRLSAWPHLVGWSPISRGILSSAQATTHLNTVTLYPEDSP
ncbi:MAG: phage tail protein I [Porticoccaceae bacterium]